MAQATLAHQATLRRESAAVIGAVRGQWARMGLNFDSSWASIADGIVATVSLGQRRVAEDSYRFIPDVLDEKGYRGKGLGESLSADPFIGFDGSGYRLDEVLRSAVTVAKVGVRDGKSTAEALRRGGERLARLTQLTLADTARQAERVALAPTSIVRYERALTLPSCSRCAVLAGRLYRVEAPFQRHPMCDCIHDPVVGADFETIDPRGYFNSLPTAAELEERFPGMTVKQRQKAGYFSQEDVFTKAGAEAIRSGADISQVVNARRGMYSARGWQFTREGVTRRGRYGRHNDLKGRRRLMPEQIQKIAKDKDDYRRLLRLYQYL